MNPEACTQNTATGVRIRGELDHSALERALAKVVARHDSLRTAFRVVSGEPMQLIASHVAVEIPRIDFDRQARDLNDWVRSELRRVFDLERAPLFRPFLATLGPSDYAFVLILHHIIGDGWSAAIFFSELANFYNAEVSDRLAVLPTLDLRYADFAVWEREWLQTTGRAQESEYWLQRLSGTRHVLELPIDFPRPLKSSGDGARVRVPISAGMYAAVRQLARNEKTTPFVVLLAAFELLLSRYAAADDFVVATPVANRRYAELSGVIGYFANMAPLRAQLRPQLTFRALLRDQHSSCMAALAHSELPFEQIVSDLRIDRDLSRQALAQVMFSLQHSSSALLSMGGAKVETLEFDGGMTTFDLVLWFRESGETSEGWIKYRTDLFLPGAIDSMAQAYGQILSTVLADPEITVADVPLVAARPELIVVERQSVPDMRDHAFIHRRVEHWAAIQPERNAVSDGERHITWGEFEKSTNRLAHHLRALGGGLDDIVAFCLDDPIDRIIATVAILKSGAGFMPLDVVLPDQRLDVMIEDAQPRILVTHSRLAGRFRREAPQVLLDRDETKISGCCDESPRYYEHADSLAYVIYTSGSTGRPKGVLITHRGIAHFMERQIALFAPAPTDRVLQFASPSFDASVLEIFLALAHGAALDVAEQHQLLPGEPLQHTLMERGITIAHLTPSALATIEPARYGLRHLITGAETLSAPLARRWASEVTLSHAYGPTETTVFATLTRLEPDFDRLTIGKPLPGMRAYIVDANLQLLPTGVPGEILIGGPGLARGYLQRAGLTAERFIPDPFSGLTGDRLYRSGDLGRLLPDGNIEYLGRRDHQVKIRGYRIELSEIEAHLSAEPAVAECAVVVRESPGGDPELVAYLRLRPGAAPQVSELRTTLRDKLPAYMVPAAFVIAAEFPRTATGKLDRTALALIAPARTTPEPRRSEAGSDFEEEVNQTWSSLFGVARVGRDESFFDLGGNSLLLLRAQGDLEKRLGRKVPIVEMFRNPTVAALAAYLAGTESDAPPLWATSHRDPAQANALRQRLNRRQNRATESVAENR